MVLPARETRVTHRGASFPFRAGTYSSPTARPNRARAPTLRNRLSQGWPLRKGENSWSKSIT